MGWGSGIVEGREVGYCIEDTCAHAGCEKVIDRGLAYACGERHESGDGCCAGYFCSDHLVFTLDKPGQHCFACAGVEADDLVVMETAPCR